ncbi:hypothetical protein CEB3_c21510 [Peptococcaceae bacterium CEB3]|nr:hypothetical protein CEB3_c21510 [Peptococcaceae bacterium CEB3]
MQNNFQLQNEVLPESTFGVVFFHSRTIIINTEYAWTKTSKYYTALLENAAEKGYDCKLEIIGGEAILHLSMPMKYPCLRKLLA